MITEEEIRKAVDKAIEEMGDIFVTQVAPNLFRIGGGKNGTTTYTSREGVKQFNKAMRQAHEDAMKGQELMDKLFKNDKKL